MAVKGGHHRRLTSDDIRMACEMKDAGLKLKEIAAYLGCNPATVTIHTRGTKARHHQIPLWKIAKIQEMKEQGFTYLTIMVELDVSINTIRRHAGHIPLAYDAKRLNDKGHLAKRAVQLSRDGFSRAAIARQLGVGHATVTRWLDMARRGQTPAPLRKPKEWSHPTYG